MKGRMTREALSMLLDELLESDPTNYQRINEVQYDLKTICSHCHRSGAVDHRDQQGIYAGRWHPECETEADRYRAGYRWSPEDEPLDDPDALLDLEMEARLSGGDL